MRLYETPDLVPDHKPALSPSGKPTLHKRNKTERNELYAVSLASKVLATAKEALAMAPVINKVAVMVVRKDEEHQSCWRLPLMDQSETNQSLQTGYARTFRNTNTTEPVAYVGAPIKRKGRTAEVVSLNISDIPDLTAVLQSAAEGLATIQMIQILDLITPSADNRYPEAAFRVPL